MLHWMTPRAALKHIGRYNRIIAVFIKYGFGEFFQRIRIWEYRNIERRLFKRGPHEFPHLSEPERLRLALAELGPTFVKLGQMLSTRPDIMPHEFIVELEKLQEHAEYVSAEAIRNVIQAELGRPVEEVFDSFSDEPLAAASLAQVHRAVLGGEEVVIKVQRPDITEAIHIDLDIMHFLATLWERYSAQAYYIRPVGLVEEFTEDLKRELDFGLETNNMTQFARNFAGEETLHVPDVYQELSTRKMIVMEFIDGISISNVQRLTDEGYDLPLIARRGADISFRAALEFGFFHSDPHPGNVLVLPGNVVSLLDYG
ncbi:MAG: AarF/UbiB family protein, partial [Dehalococcoidales bacterium]